MTEVIKEAQAPSFTVAVTHSKTSLKGILSAYRKRNHDSRVLLFDALMDKVELTGEITKPSQIVNALCVKVLEVDNIHQAREGKVDGLKDIEDIQNFLSSWVDFGKDELAVATKNIKVARREASKASTSDSSEVVTFSKSSAIAMLDRLAQATGISRKAKSLALQLADELE